jgi:hypothetical protein
MRTWRVLILLSAGGCLGQIIPGHDPTAASDPAPSSDEPAAAPDPTPTSSPPAARNGLDGGVLDVTPTSIRIESEAATLTAPMTILLDPAASGQHYIAVPTGGTGGKALFTFDAPADGDYVLWGSVIGPTDNNNSFHVSLDGDVIDNDATDGASTIWDLPVTTTWTWARLNMRVAAGNTDLVLHLTAGPHTLYLNQREVLSGLDRLILTSDAGYIPN